MPTALFTLGPGGQSVVERLPVQIGPGDSWLGLFADKSKLIERGLKQGIVGVFVSVSHQDKPVLCRIQVIKGPLFELVEDPVE